jgi:hypothetical protein
MARNPAKSRVFRCAALGPVALIAVLPAASAHGQAARPDAVFSVHGRVTHLAADGNRAAVTTRLKGGCGRIVVWTAPGKHSVTARPGILGCAGDGIFQLALGSGRVSWIEEGGGNTLEMSVMAADLVGGTRKQVEYAANGDRAGSDPEGDWVGQLLGRGSLLAYNSWTQVCDRPAAEQCGNNDPFLRLTNQKLVRIANGRRLVVTRGATAYPLLAVGGGRMAVGGSGAVTIRAANGSQVAAVLDPAGTARAVALSTTRLAIQRTLTIDLYNPATGAAVKALPSGTASWLRLRDVTARLALLQGSHRLVLLRLSDGKRIPFPLGPRAAASLVAGRLTEAGLFYAYNTRSVWLPGRIVFEPMRKLLGRF